jgi:hypothetical protein
VSGRRDRTLAQVDDPAERFERPDELQQQRDEQRQLADREVAVDHVPAAEIDDGCDPEGGEEEQARQEARLDRCLPHRLVPHRLGALAEAVADVLLAPKRLHHLDSDDNLV